MKYTYAELKKMMEEAKEEAKREVVSVLAQKSDRNHRMCALAIAEAANVPVGSVVGWLTLQPYSNWDYCPLTDTARRMGLKVRREKMKEYTTYINPLNPNDTVKIGKERYMYWVERA